MRRNLKRVITFFATVFLMVSFANPSMAFFKNKFETEVEIEEGAVKLVREVIRGNYNIIDAKELNQWINSKREMIIVDTMPFEDSYKKEHVPGATQFLFPIPEMVTWEEDKTSGKSVQDFEKLLGSDKNKIIVIYCGFVKCTRSHNGAMWAKKLGYTTVYRFSGGIFAWKGKGYPVETVK